MKVCLIAPIPPFRGGIAKYCYSLAQELEKRHELLLLSYRRQYPALLYGNKPQIDPEYDRSTIAKDFRRISYDIDSMQIASWIEAARRIDSFSPDVVILPWWVTFWTPLYLWLMRHLRKKNIKCLLLCINVYEHEDSLFKKILTRLVLRRAGLVIVHSALEQAELQKINCKASVRRHLLPVFSYETSASIRSGSRLNLLFFGFVRPYKGLDLLLRAVAMAADLDIKLKVVGELWHGSEEYLNLIRELKISGMVEIVDRYVSDTDMAGYFAWSDLVVLPYRASKTSGVIATSYGFGKPVLATDVGGFHEVVLDGYTGKLVKPGDPRAIAEGIQWFNNNRHLDFERNIASFVDAGMSWRSLVDTIEGMVLF
ncbi:MAG: glycosyltransferase [Desulfuromonadaceae bacterium]|nr:glycosyltransferase [Desulfuromonadaceae bacterium]